MNVDTALQVPLAFVNLIAVAEQCSSTTRIGQHHCGHRTGAVLSSDKHRQAVLGASTACQCMPVLVTAMHSSGPMAAVMRSYAGSAQALLPHRNQVYKCRAV